MLRILPALRAEAAADVAGDHADLVLGDAQDVGGQRGSHAMRVLHVGVERVALLARVPGAESAARLHVLRVDTCDDVAPADHARGAAEGGLGRRAVADLVDVRDVVGALLPHRGAPHRVRRRGHRGKRLVVDLQQLGCVLGLGEGVGHDHRDRIPDVARALTRQAVVGRRPHRRAVGPLALEGHLHRAKLGDVGAGEDGQHAGRAPRAGGVDGHDPRVGVDRAHDHGVCLAGQVHVVVKAPSAPHEADVLEPLDRLADSELSHGPVVTHFDGAGSSPGAISLLPIRKKLHDP